MSEIPGLNFSNIFSFFSDVFSVIFFLLMLADVVILCVHKFELKLIKSISYILGINPFFYLWVFILELKMICFLMLIFTLLNLFFYEISQTNSTCIISNTYYSGNL
ncbi:hypothetical protein OBPA_02460 [Polaribacter sp. OB-PA-B3]